jgi:hypothetical protein
MPDLPAVFAELRAIMLPYAEKLDVKTDTDTELYVDTKHVLKNGKPLFFGAVQVEKKYVSYHLMPVYVAPDLLQDLSADLKARMQGKSCFNFTRVEQPQLQELAALTEAGFRRYEESGYVLAG